MKLLKIEECFNDLKDEYDYGGGETEDGELEPGVPDWEKAKRKVYDALDSVVEDFKHDIDELFNSCTTIDNTKAIYNEILLLLEKHFGL